MKLTFKFADGRERKIDPPTHENMPLDVGMQEIVERKFSLEWHSGQPCYVERETPTGADGSGPIGGLTKAVCKYLFEQAQLYGDADDEKDALLDAAAGVAKGDHLLKFLVVRMEKGVAS